MYVVVREVVLVEQLGQLVECLLMLVGDHSAKLEGQAVKLSACLASTDQQSCLLFLVTCGIFQVVSLVLGLDSRDNILLSTRCCSGSCPASRVSCWNCELKA